MSRPFALTGFTFFLTFAILNTMSAGATVIALVAFSVVSVLSFAIRSLRKERTMVVFALSGVLACVYLACFNIVSYVPTIALCESEHIISAYLTDVPNLRYGKYYYNARITSVDGEKANVKTRLVFSVQPDAEAFDKVEGEFVFYIPGGSGSESDLRSDGIFVCAYPKNDITLISDTNGHMLGRAIVKFRIALKSLIYKFLPNENGDLAIGLLLGDTSGFGQDTYNSLKLSGLMHIVSVSGFHLSLWSALILEIFRKLGFREKFADVFASAGVLLFMCVAGFTYPIMRSGIMMLIYLFGGIILRRRDSLNSLGFALLAITLLNPYSANSIGLELSALATLGITVGTPVLENKIGILCSPIKSNQIRKAAITFLRMIGVSLVAASFSLPVSLLNFGTFNFLAVFANAAIGLVAGPCMVFCALGSLFCFLFPSAINVFGMIGGLICNYILFVSRLFSGVEKAIFTLDKDICVLVICGILTICSFAFLLAYFGKPEPFACFVLCFLIFISSVLFSDYERKGETLIRVADVGNGTAVSITKGDSSVLFGCGGSYYNSQESIMNLYNRSSNGFDFVLIPDAESYGSACFKTVLSEFSPEKIYTDALPSNDLTSLIRSSEVIPLDGMSVSGEIGVDTISDGEISCSYIKTEDVSVLICYDPPESDAEFSAKFKEFDIIIVRGDYPKNIAGNIFCVINCEHDRGVILEKELDLKGVNCVATAGCGDIIIRAKNGYTECYRAF